MVIRTTFIVGFPGETEEDFRQLSEFMQQQRFDHAGVFTYSARRGHLHMISLTGSMSRRRSAGAISR